MYTQENTLQTFVKKPQVTPSVEIRWFRKGRFLLNVEQWFQAECPGQLEEREERCDRYLYTPGSEAVTLKLRENCLELKHRQGLLTEPRHGHRSISPIKKWDGQIERWLKWTYPLEYLKFYEASYKDQPWTIVHKTRWQRSFRGATIELTLLDVEQIQWWSLAFEAQPQTSDTARWFSQIVDAVNATYRGPSLSTDYSYSYPTWLSKLCDDNSQNFTDV